MQSHVFYASFMWRWLRVSSWTRSSSWPPGWRSKTSTSPYSRWDFSNLCCYATVAILQPLLFRDLGDFATFAISLPLLFISHLRYFAAFALSKHLLFAAYAISQQYLFRNLCSFATFAILPFSSLFCLFFFASFSPSTPSSFLYIFSLCIHFLFLPSSTFSFFFTSLSSSSTSFSSPLPVSPLGFLLFSLFILPHFISCSFLSNSLLLYTPSLLLVINHSPSLSLLCLSLCLFLLFFDLLLLTLFYSVLFSSYFFSRSPLLFSCHMFNAETMLVTRIFYAVFIQFYI